MALTASQEYYQHCTGDWRARMRFDFTSWSAMIASPMAWIDKLSLLSLIVATKLGVPVTMQTTVRKVDELVYAHTTAVLMLGVASMKSTETINLASDGHTGTMHGAQSQLPLFWRTQELTATIEIADDYSAATYELIWMRENLRQTTTRTDSLVTIDQTASWFTGHHPLHRQA